MDLNPPQNLDPKLKEAYERIMANRPRTPIINNDIADSEDIKNDNQPTISKSTVSDGTSLNPKDNTKSIQTSTPSYNSQNENSLLSRFLKIGAIIFLIIYAFFWTKFFNLI